MTAARLGGILRARGIRGVLAAPLPGNQTAFELDVAQLCVVGVGISVVEPAVMRVAGDLFQIGRLAVRHCAELGYRRIGFAVSVEMSERLEHRLLAGYRQGLFDVSQPETVAPLMPPRTADFASHLPAWYAREQPEVVIFGTFDDKCQRTLPPEIGCVATSVMSSVSPLTGVFQNLRTVGAIAVEQLLGELYHNATGPLDGSRTYYLQGRWNPGITAPGPGARRVAIVVDA